MVDEQPVGGARVGRHMQAEDEPFVDKLGALAGDHGADLMVHVQLHLRIEDLGIGLEQGRNLAQTRLPGRAIERDDQRFVDGMLGLFPRKAGHRLVLDHLGDPGAALLVQQSQCLLVAGVGLQPQGGAQGIHVVVHGNAHRRLVAIEVVQVEQLLRGVVGGVVELVAAHPDFHVGLANMLIAVLQQGPETRGQVVVVVVAHEIADEIRPFLAGESQLLLGPVEFGFERVEQDQPRVGGRGRGTGGERARQPGQGQKANEGSQDLFACHCASGG